MSMPDIGDPLGGTGLGPAAPVGPDDGCDDGCDDGWDDGWGVPSPAHVPVWCTACDELRKSASSSTPRCHMANHIRVAAAAESRPDRSWSMACMWWFQVVIAVR